jgi:hypothetical protein
MDSKPAVATEAIIDLFGGIRPMAGKLDTPVTTVQGWKKRGSIPRARHADIIAAAGREGVDLDPATLAASDPATPPESGGFPPGAAALGETAPADAPSPPSRIVARRGGAAAGLALGFSLLTLAAGTAGAFAAWRFYIQPLESRVAALEARPTSVAAPASDAAVEDLRAHVKSVEARLEQETERVASTDGKTGDTVTEGSGSPQRPGGPQVRPGAAEPDQIAALEKQVAEIKASSAESAQLAKRLSDLQVAAGGRELLSQSIMDIQSSMAATQGEVERLANQLSALGSRVDKVDSALLQRRQQSLRAEAVMLAVGELRAALRTDAPFAKEIAAIRALIDGDSQISTILDQIQPYADDGAPSVDDLRGQFGHLAPDIVRGAVVGDGGEWWRQALYHIESVILVRRVGDSAKGDGVDAIVARAEGKLDEDDLKGAIAALQSLTGLAADVARPWVHDAQERVTIDNAAADLTRLSIERIASGDGQAAGPSQSQAQPQQGQP